MGSYIEEFQEQMEKKSQIIVSVDGPAGAGKGTLAEHISEKLDLDHFSASDVFYQVAEEKGLTEEELSKKADKEIDRKIDRKTLERALEKSCVVDSRISSWVLGDFSDLKIHLTADFEARVRRLASREDIRLEKAREKVEKRDREDYSRYKKYYGIDRDDLSIYDVLIDNTDFNIKEQNRVMDKILRRKFPGRFE